MGQLSTNINAVDIVPIYTSTPVNPPDSITHILGYYFYIGSKVIITGSFQLQNSIGIDTIVNVIFAPFQTLLVKSCIVASSGIQGNNHFLYGGLNSNGQVPIYVKMDSSTDIQINYQLTLQV